MSSGSSVLASETEPTISQNSTVIGRRSARRAASPLGIAATAKGVPQAGQKADSESVSVAQFGHLARAIGLPRSTISPFHSVQYKI